MFGDPPAGAWKGPGIQERGVTAEMEGSQVTRPAGDLGFSFEPHGVHRRVFG